jgi:formylglycine-generating enzyme required for sulfatase activity
MKNSAPFSKTKTILLSAVFIFISLTMISVSAADGQHSRVPDNMVLVKGGCFQMGDIFSDVPSSEKPVHEVCVDDFYMGKYEVTVGEFRKFVKETAYRTEAEWQNGCHCWEDIGWHILLSNHSYNEILRSAQNDRKNDFFNCLNSYSISGPNPLLPSGINHS